MKPQLLIAAAAIALLGTVAVFGLDFVGRSTPHDAPEVAYPVITEESDVRTFVGQTVTLRGQYKYESVAGPKVLGVRVGSRSELYGTVVDVTGRLELYVHKDPGPPKEHPDLGFPPFPCGPFSGSYLRLANENGKLARPAPVSWR